MDSTLELTMVHGVGQSHCVMGVYKSHVEDSFHSWLVKAGEGFPGICWLHLSSCNNSDNSRQQK